MLIGKRFLFEGQTEGKQYDARSLQQVLKQALKKLTFLNRLRHSYATRFIRKRYGFKIYSGITWT